MNEPIRFKVVHAPGFVAGAPTESIELAVEELTTSTLPKTIRLIGVGTSAVRAQIPPDGHFHIVFGGSLFEQCSIDEDRANIIIIGFVKKTPISA